MFFLVCKLYKLALYITAFFGHGQCFTREFLVLAFIETARLNTTSSCNLSWSGNDTILVCKLYMSNLQVKTLILDMSEILNNIYIDRFLLVAFVNIFYGRSTAFVFRTVLFDTLWRLWKLSFFEENFFRIIV